jgi:rod shape-determining protein MreC
VPRNRSTGAVLDASVSRPRPQSFPSRIRSPLRRRAVLGVLCVLALVLITVSFREPTGGALHGVEATGVTILQPFEVGAERVARPFRDVYGYATGLIHAKRENRRLRAEIDTLRQVVIQNQSAQQQVAALKGQLHYIDSPQFPSDFAPVNTSILARAPSDFEQQVEINAGSNAGLRLDTPVVTQDGLVGRVTQVTGSTAQVTLITDADSAVQALDLRSGAIGLLRHGQGQGQLILDLVTKEQDVSAGDTIVTSGTRSRQYPSLFPRGIAIGKVLSVGQSDTSVYKQIQIEPYVDFSGLDSVTALVARKGRRAKP